MFKFFTAIYYVFWVLLAIGSVGDIPSCEPFEHDLPFTTGAFLAIGMAFAYLAGREDQ